MGRPAFINSEAIKKVEHLELLDEQEQTLVKLRWGHTTGKPLTQEETARYMKLGREQVRRIEAKIVARIAEQLNDDSPRKGVFARVTMKQRQVSVNLTDIEFAAVDQFANKNGLTPTEVTRDAVLRTVLGRRKYRKHVKARK